MPTILIAENDPDFLTSLVEDVFYKKYTILTAMSPNQARAMFTLHNPDLLLTDLRLTNDDDPIDITGYILAKEVCKTIPVIVQSSDLPEELEPEKNLVLRSKGKPRELLDLVASLLLNTD